MKNNNPVGDKQSRGGEKTGIVRSVKMGKTVVVEVVHVYRHPIYKKAARRTKRYKAHYEGTDITVGDRVIIRETKPISKDKHFIVMGKSL